MSLLLFLQLNFTPEIVKPVCFKDFSAKNEELLMAKRRILWLYALLLIIWVETSQMYLSTGMSFVQ